EGIEVVPPGRLRFVRPVGSREVDFAADGHVAEGDSLGDVVGAQGHHHRRIVQAVYREIAGQVGTLDGPGIQYTVDDGVDRTGVDAGLTRGGHLPALAVAGKGNLLGSLS